MVSIEEFLDSFDGIDTDALQPVVQCPLVSIEHLDISEILATRPTTERLFDRAEQTRKDIRSTFPEATSLWMNYRQPTLDIKPLREAYLLTFADKTRKVVQNPYSSQVWFRAIAHEDVPRYLGVEDVMADAGDAVITISPTIRVVDDECAVTNAIIQYELFPYVVKTLGLERAKAMREPIAHALALMLGKFDPEGFFGSNAVEARRLYERSKSPRDVIQNAA